MNTDIETTEALGVTAIFAAAAIEQGSGEQFCVTLKQTRIHAATSSPVYEFRMEMPGLRALMDDVHQGRLKVEAKAWSDRLQAITKGLKRATERAYTARELLTLGGGA